MGSLFLFLFLFVVPIENVSNYRTMDLSIDKGSGGSKLAIFMPLLKEAMLLVHVKVPFQSFLPRGEPERDGTVEFAHGVCPYTEKLSFLVIISIGALKLVMAIVRFDPESTALFMPLLAGAM